MIVISPSKLLRSESVLITVFIYFEGIFCDDSFFIFTKKNCLRIFIYRIVKY